MILREFINLIGYDIDEASLLRVQGQVDAFAQRMGRVGQQLTLLLSAPIAAGAAFALKASSDIEQASVSFEVFTGSAAKAKKLMSEIVELSVKTPLRFDQVLKGAENLMAYSVKAEEAVPILKMLGDLSRGRPELLGRLITAYGQSKTATMLTGQELRQFTEAGVPLVEYLSKVTGIEAKTLVQSPKKAGVTFEQVHAALVAMTSEGGRFFNLMERQAQTLAGVFSNLFDAMFFFSAQIGNDIAKVLRLHEVIKAFSESLKKLLEKYNQLDDSQKAVIFSILALAVAIGPVMIGLAGIMKIGSFVVTTFNIMSTAVMGLNAGLGAFLMRVLLIPGAIAAALFAIYLLIDEVVVWMKGRESFLRDWLGPFDEFSKKASKFIDPIKEAILSAWNFITGVFSSDKERAQKGLEKFIDTVIDYAQMAFTTFIESKLPEIIAKGLLNLIPTLWKIYDSIMTTLLDSIIVTVLRKLGLQLPEWARRLIGISDYDLKDNKNSLANNETVTKNREKAQRSSDIANNFISEFLRISNAYPIGDFKPFLQEMTNLFSKGPAPSITNHIKVEVPPGTTEQQVGFIEAATKKIVTDHFNLQLRKAVAVTPD